MRRPRPTRLLTIVTAVAALAVAVVIMGQVAAHAPQVERSTVARMDEGSRSQLRPPLPPEALTVEPDDEADIAVEPSPESSQEPTLTDDERADLTAGVLDRDVPQAGSGELQALAGEQEAPHEAGRVVRVRVEVEEGLPIDAEAFGAFVMDTLNDPRGWGHDGSVVFARTAGEADIRVVLASPDLTDSMCLPLRTVGRYSCGRDGHAVLNAVRWASATEAFLAEATITDYRHYLITHEVGHLLGHQHRDCPAEGETAHVMQQQTISLQGCRPNGWAAP